MIRRRGTQALSTRGFVVAFAGIAFAVTAGPAPQLMATTSPRTSLPAPTAAPTASHAPGSPMSPKLPPTTASEPLPSLLLVGDSVADTLQGSLAAEANARGMAFSATTRPGCDVITGIPAYPNGTPVSWGPGCSDTTTTYLANAVHQTNPNVVLWLSTWGTADRIVDGVFYQFGTRESDAMLLGRFDETRRILTAGGARLVIVNIAPHAVPSEVNPTDDPAQDAQYLHLDTLYQRFAAQHRDSVTVVDLDRIVCPTGPPCPQLIAGVALRPHDGSHFAGDGPAWVAPRLLNAIMRELRPAPRVAIR